MGVQESQLPTLRAIVPAGQKKYEFSGDLTVDAVGNFVDGVLEGKLKPHLLSDPVPKEQKGYVTIVVGKEFDKIVKDPTKDVFVFFHAPWCGHCKSLAPIWKALARHYKASTDLVIATVNGDTNEIEDLELRAYPTLILYPKDNKQGITFEGQRRYGQLKKFLEEQLPGLGAVKEGPKRKDEL